MTLHQPENGTRRHDGRLLFLAHLTERSGAPRVTLDLARGLAARGRGVLACFPAGDGLADDARAAGLQVLVVGNPQAGMAGARGASRARLLAGRLRALRGYWRVFRRPDVALVWCGSTVAALPAAIARMAGKAVVVHVHEDLVPTAGNRLRRWLVRRAAHDVVFVAARSRMSFGRQPRGQRWHYLANGVDTAPFDRAVHGDRAAVRRELGAGEADRVFLALAHLSPRKGTDILVDAFELVARSDRRAVLWVAGGAAAGDEAFAAAVRDKAGSLPCAGRIRFLGVRSDAPRLLAAADALVLASRNEAAPLTVVEAMLAARPVAATDVGDVAAMLRGNGAARTVPPGDPAALARAMSEVTADPAAMAPHALAARERARSAYSQAAQADRAARIADACLARLDVPPGQTGLDARRGAP